MILLKIKKLLVRKEQKDRTRSDKCTRSYSSYENSK